MPFDQHYSWTRYWAPRDQMSLFSDSAFVPEPETLLGTGLPMHELSDVRDVPLLILLGQPGQGKSTTIDEEIAALTTAGILTARVDLLGLDSGTLVRDVLVGSTELSAWLDGAELHVFVDGLDRAQVELSTVQRVLELALKAPAAAMSRLRLRIACRSADWEDAVADRLAGLWPIRETTDGIVPRSLTLELLNLTYAAFAIAAATHGLNPEVIAAEIDAKGAAPLASVPVTLAMILDVFAEEGVLGTRTELYHRACGRLVARGLPAGTTLRTSDALALAARQAAALMLCDAAALTTDDESTRAEITVFDLAGGTEPSLLAAPDAPPVIVERQPLLDLHGTGLMRATGDRAVFFHQTIAEYLCATWLASGRLSQPQVDALLVNPYDSRRQLLPHLRDVAGWLAALDPSTFGSLIKTQARVLLRGDLAQLEPQARSDLVAALLVPDDGDHVAVWNRQVRDGFRRLGHPRLAEQLRGPLRDREADDDVRLIAIALAEANHVSALTDDLLTVAFDRDAAFVLRHTAVQAVGAIGDVNARQALLPLALEDQPEDRGDEVKGAALSATWPGLIDAPTLLAALTPAKRENFYGNYQLFLTRAAADISSDDLAAAVDWCASQPRAAYDTRALAAFADGVIDRAWHELDRDDVACALARLAATRLERHRELIGSLSRRKSAAFDDQAGRRTIVARLVPRVGGDGIHPRYLSFSKPALIRPEDVDWMCDMLRAEPDAAVRVRWAQLIEATFWPEQSPVDRVQETAAEFPELAEALRFWLGSVDLNSEEAALGRQRHAQINAVEDADPDDETREDVDIDVEIQKLLDAGEAGDLEAWWQLNTLMVYDATGHGQASEIDPRISASPGWSRADPRTRKRLIDLALDYVGRRDAEPDQWVGKAIGWRPARAGVRALVLLGEIRPERWQAFSAELWETWAPAIVAFPWIDTEGSDPMVTTLGHLRDVAPDALVHWLVALIRAGDSADVLVRLRLPLVIDLPALQPTVLTLADDDALPVDLRIALFTAALDADFGIDAALDALGRVAESFDDPTDDTINLAVGLLSLLLQRAPATVWPVAWPIFQTHPAVGRQTIEGLVSYESHELATDLEESRVADLFLWLHEQYPRAEDPPDENGFVGARKQVAWWRDRLIEVLIQRRTTEAVDALRRLHATLPEVPFLARRLRAAEIARAEELWTPPRPRDLVRLTEDRSRRLVQSPEQLQAVVLESLARANERLQGAWPKAWQLWNDEPLQPKSEERLSDWLKDWLDADLARRLVTTREPQVKPTRSGKGIGARNDIRIDLPADGDRDALATVVEVKRCWHRKVFTAAQTQLAEGYLSSANLSHGIYLVGFYDAQGWIGSGSTTARRRTLDGWRAKIAEVAQAASDATGRHIAPVVLDVSLVTDRLS